MPIEFIRDPQKNTANVRKHSVSFDEAKSVFFDDYARLLPDPDHSADEQRFIISGMSLHARILIVCHCYREDDALIRIISARKATKNEKNQYMERLP